MGGELISLAPARAQSDAQLLTATQTDKAYLKHSITFISTLDLTPLYDVTPPQESSLAVTLRVLRRVSHQSSSKVMAESPRPYSTQTSGDDQTADIDQLARRVTRALQGWPNLKVTSATNYRKSARRASSYQRLMALTRTFVRSALEAYREVDLDRALASLDSALELMFQARQVIISPDFVARLSLFRGMIAVERKQYLRASIDFQRALLLNPKLRLKSGFDHRESLRVFNDVLRQLRGLSTAELIRLTERREWSELRGPALALIKVKGRVFSLLYRPPSRIGIGEASRESLTDVVTRERYSWESADLASRVASRVWACLPLTRTKQSDQAPLRLRIFGGWQADVALRSPVSPIASFGATVKVIWNVLSQLDLQLGGSWSTSTRDTARDLQTPLTSWTAYLGPQWTRHWSRAWISLGLMIETSWLSRVTITRAVGCKYFDLSSPLPPEICDPERDLRRVKDAWRFGPRVEVSAGLKIADRILISAQLFSSLELYQSSAHPFGYPLGGAVLLGYSFHSR